MKAHEALIAWTPVDTPDCEQTAGEVEVLPRAGGYNWPVFFARVGGAAYVERRKLRGGLGNGFSSRGQAPLRNHNWRLSQGAVC